MTRGVAISVAVLALAPIADARTYSQHEIAAIIRQTFPADSARALCIADHESDGTPGHWTAEAVFGSMTGLFQINRRTWDPTINPRARPIVGVISWGRMLEPAYNAMVARRIYLHSGWAPWSTRGACGA